MPYPRTPQDRIVAGFRARCDRYELFDAADFRRGCFFEAIPLSLSRRCTPFDALCDPAKRERDTNKKYRVDE
jgi:hypothetical protein